MDITVQPTPNPNALKFILDQDVKSEGKVSFKTPQDCKDIPLAAALFDLRGVDQIHFFQNVITISKFSFEEWDNLEPAVQTCIESFIEDHNPEFKVSNPEDERRASLSPELRHIEEILDKKIRPGLQGDGGDLAVQDFKENVLIVKYQGACGTCPSSTTGTLEAIRSILKDEVNPEIEVYLAPEV
jgi:NFU1 iron-sulfur cluster scaffold homolog, mitochondrial